MQCQSMALLRRFENRNKLKGGDLTVSFMCPAGEELKANQFKGFKIHLSLCQQIKLIIGDCLPNVVKGKRRDFSRF